MVTYGGLQPAVAVAVNAALIAFMALYPALFALIVRQIVRRFGPVGLWAAVPAWVATELGRTHLFGGFPWVLLGYSQVDVLPIAQLASLGGVFAVSGLIVVPSVAVVVGVWSGSGDVGRWRFDTRPLASAGILISLIAVWGGVRVRESALTQSGETIPVGLVQGNVDQGDKWAPARAREIFYSYLGMSRQAVSEGARLVIWPESAIPFRFEEDVPAADQVRALARNSRVSLLLGSDQVERQPPRYYNAAYMVREDGSTGGVYRKMHLVPFGEYVPLKRLFFFAAPLVEAVSDFSPGTELVLLPVGAHWVSTAICYEIVYPDLVRRAVRDGSQLLTTITNDAWFGRTSAPYQHFAQASMRAIENGRYLVRSANTGISGIVDPYGRVLARSSLFEPAVLVGEVRFLQGATLYVRIGDAVAYGCVAAVAGLLAMPASSRRRRIQ
jgi:apolipoprotein N-acyltransferase